MSATTALVWSDAATLLSRWWSRPLEGVVAEWDRSWDLARDLADAIGLEADAVEELAAARHETSTDALLDEYERLFVGPSRPCCPPYESFWRSDGPKLEQGRLMGSPTRAVGDLYRELELDVAEDAHELPDHVAIEWEALGYALHRGGTYEASVASRLLHEHLRRWLPAFCAVVLEQAHDPFYRALANLTARWVEGLAGAVAEP